MKMAPCDAACLCFRPGLREMTTSLIHQIWAPKDYLSFPCITEVGINPLIPQPCFRRSIELRSSSNPGMAKKNDIVLPYGQRTASPCENCLLAELPQGPPLCTNGELSELKREGPASDQNLCLICSPCREFTMLFGQGALRLAELWGRKTHISDSGPYRCEFFIRHPLADITHSCIQPNLNIQNDFSWTVGGAMEGGTPRISQG